MRIRAVRLADLGCFREPVALEGLSGGLDVLAGPNEIGKSTIFRAIEAAFLKKYNTTSFDGITPRGGGDPIVEVEFEAQGRAWRLTKRFSRSAKGRLAELMDLTTGKVEAKALDAETRLDDLIGRNGTVEGRFGLLWIGQDPGRVRWAHKDDDRGGLEPLIEAEVASVAGGAELARVRRRLQDLLDAETTRGGRQPKAHSAYAAALARRRQLGEQLAAARAKAADTAAKLDELVALRRRQGERADAESQARLSEALTSAESRLQIALLAQAEHGDARAKAADARSAREALRSLDACLDELGKASAVREAEQIAVTELEQLAAAATDAVKAAEAEVHRLASREQTLASLIRAHEQAEVAAERRTRHDEAAQQLAAAHALIEEMAATEARIALMPMTAGLLKAIDDETQAIAVLEARLSAALPTLMVDYLPGREGAVQAGGRALAGGQAVKVDGVLVLEIAGVGRLRLEAGSGEGMASDRADLEARRQTLAEQLATAGVADLTAARAAHGERVAAEQAIETGRHRLATLAPKGVPVLAAAVAELARGFSAEAAPELPPRPAIEAELVSVRGALGESRRRQQECFKDGSDVRNRLHSLTGAASARAERMKQLEASLPPPSQRAATRQQLVSSLTDRDMAAVDAERRARALAPEPPTDTIVASLKAERANAEQALRRHLEETQMLARSIERLEGELEEAYRGGGGRRAAELEGEAQLAEAEVQRHERELAALRLLAEEIDKVEHEQRGRYLKPVTDRLDPYLAAMFPAARARFGGGLALDALERAGTAEALAELSGGTQEQIAVLVRLAFARLLADAGHPAPVILDDALVYSDDERIVRLLGILESASTHHQVIVLTCRTRSLDSLAGTRLSLTPWRRD